MFKVGDRVRVEDRFLSNNGKEGIIRSIDYKHDRPICVKLSTANYATYYVEKELVLVSRSTQMPSR